MFSPKYLTLAFLGLAMIGPVGIRTMQAQPAGNYAYGLRDDDDRRKDEKRIYDRDHKDYHNWDQREDAAYRHWLEERHEAYRDYAKLNAKRQAEYWKWRHEHSDWDDRK
jgi:hypothetical protein